MLCVSSAFGAGYTCPTNRKYTTCNEGYYLAYSYTGTSYDSIKHWSTPRAGNACRPCTDYDTHYNKPKGYYYCEGKTAAPVLNKFTITYDLNGGSGTTPDNESCTKGQTCTLNDGATTSFYRAGYVFKGWGLTRTATIAFTSRIFNADDIVYAVWEECGVGKYKPGSGTQAAAACSSCPELTTGFEYYNKGGQNITDCREQLIDPSSLNDNCVNLVGEDEPVVFCQVSSLQGKWDSCYVNIGAAPGAYINPDIGTNINIDYIPDIAQLCLPCGIGTYSEGGEVTSCSACPQPTDGFEYVPTTGNTSLTACKQGLKNPADINEFCEAASGTTAEELKIQCWAASDGTWGDCIRTGFPFDAKPGCYVGIPSQSQSMPVEDVVENICIQCTDGTYSEGGGATSCSACPALTTADERDGWKISSGGDGATSSQDCYAYLESYPTNCASGSFKRMLMGGGTGYYVSGWFELEPLRANPGYMVQFEDGQTTAPACVECSEGTYSPGGDVHSCSACPSGTYSDAPGAYECTACPDKYTGWAVAEDYPIENNPNFEYIRGPLSMSGDGSKTIGECYLYIDYSEMDNCVSGKELYRYSHGGYSLATSMVTDEPSAMPGYEMFGLGAGIVPEKGCRICEPGTYNPGGISCEACPSGYDDNPETGLTSADMCQISCPGGYYLAAANDATCSEVSPGYWAAEKIVNYGDTSTRTECASGLTTIGYGAGADEAADCGRVLHFGDDTLYLRSVKKTDHALHVGINGTVFYGNMGTDLSKRGLRIKLGDTTYSVYDDSM